MIKPRLDPEFEPAVLWNRTYEADVGASGATAPVRIGLMRDGKPMARRDVVLHADERHPRTFRYLERQVKCLLWAYGGNQILFSGPSVWRDALQRYYVESETGRFDSSLVGEKIFGAPLKVADAEREAIPEPEGQGSALGRHLDGFRIGFDLGGSDRKCAAVKDGNVVFSEEIRWDPYFQSDPNYHYAGIMDSLQRAAAHLPQVDAIGGSAAGVYVNNEVRVASLFRGVSPADFDAQVRRIFFRLKEAWNGVPFEVVNDGEVTALAGSMSLGDNAVLGVSLGTSMAAGYVTPEGTITTRLNELAFVPVDHRDDGPVDEWSGDRGCGVQFFSQQGVARLAANAGWSFDPEMPLAERLEEVQRGMEKGDGRARDIFDAIGICLGYAIAQYASFYKFRHVLILGRVTSGAGGQRLIEKAGVVLQEEFPALARLVNIRMPDEQMKRHGQAVAAASLPACAGRKKREEER